MTWSATVFLYLVGDIAACLHTDENDPTGSHFKKAKNKTKQVKPKFMILFNPLYTNYH